MSGIPPEQLAEIQKYGNTGMLVSPQPAQDNTKGAAPPPEATR